MNSAGLLRTLHDVYRPGRRVYEKEDLFSEYLAWLLDRSQRFRVAFAKLAIHSSADVSPDIFRDAEAETQVTTNRGGRIDLILEVDAGTDNSGGNRGTDGSALLGIECKIDIGLGPGQLKRYHRWLEDQAGRYQHITLAALTKRQLGRHSLLDCQEYPYWDGRLYWHEVGKVLERSIAEVRSERLPGIDPNEDEFLKPAGFVVFGGELQNLMEEEGMVATTRMDSKNAADMYRDYDAYRQRLDDILHLVERALDMAGIRRLLRNKGNAEDLRPKQKKPYKKGRPVSLIYHREDPPACFMFGVTVSPPNRYARKPTETVRLETYEAELIAGYKLLNESGGGLPWPREELEEIAQTLRAPTRDRAGDDLEIFVPESASYQKWVARAPVPAAGDADEQARTIGRFYRAFVSAFLTAEARDGRPMFNYLFDRHREVIGEE